MSKQPHIKLAYNIPQLGIVRTSIFSPYAALCFNFLEKYKFIEKLKKTNQLGVIKNTLNGTHHPRWEYIILQLFLIEKLKNNKSYKTGLASNISIELEKGAEELSCTELLQIWVLLLNAGHLPGTFASERGLLLALRNNKEFYKTFLKSIPSYSKSYFELAIKEGFVYNIHKFVMIFLLERHNTYNVFCGENGNKIIKLMQKSLEIYITTTDNDKINKLKFYFNRIRQISYLFLDSYYTVFPINFNISQFIFNIDDNIEELFSRYSPLNKTLNSFDNLLTNNLYNSEESSRELSIHSYKIYEMFNNIDISNLKSLRFLKNQFENDYSDFEPQLNENKEKYKTLHLSFELDDQNIANILNKELNIKLEKEWNELIGENNLLVIQNAANSKLITITIVFRGGTYYNHVLAISRLSKKLIDFKYYILKKVENTAKYKIYKLLIDEIFNKSFKDLFLFILNNSKLENNTYFKFDEIEWKPKIVCVDNYDASELDNYNDYCLSKSELYELKLTKNIAKNEFKRTKSLVSFSSVYLYNKDLPKQDVHEIDGIILNFNSDKLYICLIEAKNQLKHGKKDARNQLNKLIKEVNFQTNINIEIKEYNNPQGAYCIIPIS